MKSQEYLNAIIERLTFLRMKVSLSNPLNLTDINIVSENFYRDFFNLLYGYDLLNINIVETNAAAIDLGDEKKKIAFQITATPDLSKTKKTVTSFTKKELYKKYDRLIILNITEKTNHRDKTVSHTLDYSLDTDDDIWDISDLIKDINDLQIDRLKEIYDFLESHIKFNNDANVILSTEVQTFLALITYLSDEKQLSAGQGIIDEPDPKGKINERFSNHADFLKNEYGRLYEEYGKILEEIEIQADIGSTKIRRVGLKLSNLSDQILSKNNGNPELALNELIEHHKNLLAENLIGYDESAIKFFLLDQLIRCNVFPNKEAIKHG